MKKQTVTVTAPAKIHLSGEHSVVYGQPAVLAALDLRCRVVLEEMGDRVYFRMDGRKDSCCDWDEVAKFGREIFLAWEAYLTGGFSYWPRLREDPFGLVKVALWEASQAVGMASAVGLRVSINSDIPIGAGLGSSAALAVAVAGSVVAFKTGGLDKRLVNKIAFEVEKRQHGRPSGGDNSVITCGGLVVFRKQETGNQVTGLKWKGKLPPFFLVDSGRPAESTGEMVARVAGLPPLKRKQLVGQIGKITARVIRVFRTGASAELVELITANERRLEALGVVGKQAQGLARRFEEAGGAAKVCGAGGVESGSGMMLVTGLTEKEIRAVAGDDRWVQRVVVSQEGVRCENCSV